MGSSSSKDKYISLYNQSSLVGWSSILYLTLAELCKNNGDYQSVYATVFPLFCKVQTAAVLEAVHAVTGVVKTPLLPTLIQLGSRMFLTWGVTYNVPLKHWSFASMMISWSIAEMVRFGYHIRPKGMMRWARYNAFIVLFPWGFFSEMMLCYKSAQQVKATNHHLYLAIAGVATCFYLPGFPSLYAYMFKQRAKHLK